MSYPYAYVVCYVRCARIPHLERHNTGFYACENAVFLAYNLLPQKPLPMQKMYPANLLLSLKAQQCVSLGGVSPRGLNRSFVFQLKCTSFVLESRLRIVRTSWDRFCGKGRWLTLNFKFGGGREDVIIVTFQAGHKKKKKEFPPFDLPNTGRAPVPAEIRSHSKGPSKSINQIYISHASCKITRTTDVERVLYDVMIIVSSLALNLTKWCI